MCAERQRQQGCCRHMGHAWLELKQFTFVCRSGSPPPARLRKTGESVGCWGRPWGLPSPEEEKPGLHMAPSQPWQPHTDLWTFYLYNSLVSLSLFLYNCPFASLPLIRLLVRHHIKATNNWCSPSQWEAGHCHNCFTAIFSRLLNILSFLSWWFSFPFFIFRNLSLSF